MDDAEHALKVAHLFRQVRLQYGPDGLVTDPAGFYVQSHHAIAGSSTDGLQVQDHHAIAGSSTDGLMDQDHHASAGSTNGLQQQDHHASAGSSSDGLQQQDHHAIAAREDNHDAYATLYHANMRARLIAGEITPAQLHQLADKWTSKHAVVPPLPLAPTLHKYLNSPYPRTVHMYENN